MSDKRLDGTDINDLKEPKMSDEKLERTTYNDLTG